MKSIRKNKSLLAIVIFTFIFSLLLSGVGFDNAAEAASSIVSVTAGGEQSSYVAENSCDGNTSSRWTNTGSLSTAWIEYDLGSTKTVDYLKLMMYNGGTRTYPIKIEVGNSSFTEVWSGTTSSTSGFQAIDVNNTSGRYVRITMTGNNSDWNAWFSIYETEIWDSSSSNDKLTISSVSFGEEQSANPATASFDGNTSTRWANKGSLSNAWIKYDLGSSKTVKDVKLMMYDGDSRTYPIKIEVGDSSLTEVWSGTTLATSGLQTINVSDRTGRYVKITMTGNNSDGNGWFSIYETEIWGEGGGSSPTPTPVPGNYNVYFGLTHAHTDASASHGDLDAGSLYFEENTPDLHFEEAIANDFDFYFLADHSQYDNTFTQERWENMLDEAEDYTVDGQFVAIRGFEFSENDEPKGHMNIWNTPDFIRADDSGVDFPYMYNWLSNQRQVAPDAYAGFNHPGSTQYNNWDFLTPERRDMVTTCEVINGVNPKDGDGLITGSLHYSGYVNALDHGWRVAPRAGGDAHLVMAIHKFKYRTGILATELTREGLFEAIANRRTYATFDKNLSAQYTVNGSIMGTVFSGNPTSFDFSISASDPNTGDSSDRITKIEIIKDNGVVAKTYNPSASHSVTWNTTINDSTSKYFFVRIWTQGKSDSATAFLAPVWTGR